MYCKIFWFSVVFISFLSPLLKLLQIASVSSTAQHHLVEIVQAEVVDVDKYADKRNEGQHAVLKKHVRNHAICVERLQVRDNVQGEAQPARKISFEFQSVQKHGKCGGKRAPDEVSIDVHAQIVVDNTHKHQVVDVEADEVLGPDVENLGHPHGKEVERDHQFARLAFVVVQSVAKRSLWKHWANHKVRQKHPNGFDHVEFLEPWRQFGHIIEELEQAKEGIVAVLLHKRIRHGTLIAIVTWILLVLGQKGKVVASRERLDDARQWKQDEQPRFFEQVVVVGQVVIVCCDPQQDVRKADQAMH